MAKNAAAKRYLSKALCFLILLIRPRFTLTTDTHSLICNIMVKTRTTPGQPWCEGQCSVDGVPFLQYDNDNKATPLGDLGKAIHATQMWTDFVQVFESLGQELRKMLADTKPETTKISSQPTLQVIMLSKCEQGQIVGTSLRFNISGKYSILLNTMDVSWTLISLQGTDIMNKWKDDEELTKYLNIFIADFNHWHKEFLKHHRERTRSILRTTDVTPLTSTSQFDNNKETIIIPVAISITIPFTIIFIIILLAILIYMCVKRKFCFQGGAPCCSSFSAVFPPVWPEVNGTGFQDVIRNTFVCFAEGATDNVQESPDTVGDENWRSSKLLLSV